MLTITELLRNIEDAKRASTKAKILGLFFQGILNNATHYNNKEGYIEVEFKGEQEFYLAVDMIPELLKDNYDLKRYAVSVVEDVSDFSLSIKYDLDKPLNALKEA